MLGPGPPLKLNQRFFLLIYRASNIIVISLFILIYNGQRIIYLCHECPLLYIVLICRKILAYILLDNPSKLNCTTIKVVPDIKEFIRVFLFLGTIPFFESRLRNYSPKNIFRHGKENQNLFNFIQNQWTKLDETIDQNNRFWLIQTSTNHNVEVDTFSIFSRKNRYKNYVGQNQIQTGSIRFGRARALKELKCLYGHHAVIIFIYIHENFFVINFPNFGYWISKVDFFPIACMSTLEN